MIKLLQHGWTRKSFRNGRRENGRQNFVFSNKILIKIKEFVELTGRVWLINGNKHISFYSWNPSATVSVCLSMSTPDHPILILAYFTGHRPTGIDYNSYKHTRGEGGGALKSNLCLSSYQNKPIYNGSTTVSILTHFPVSKTHIRLVWVQCRRSNNHVSSTFVQ